MIWVPPYRIRNGDAVEPQDFTEDLMEICDQSTGALNEHNHNAAAFRRQDVARTGVYAVWQKKIADFETNTSNAGAFSYSPPRDGVWHVVGDDDPDKLTTVELDDFQGGPVWIQASLQAGTNYSGLDANNDEYRVWFALAVDGQLIPETITGGAEPDNDVWAQTDIAVATPAPGDIINDDQSGVLMPLPVVVDLTWDLAPGDHTVALMVRSGVPRRYLPAPDQYAIVKNREIAVVALYKALVF